MREEDLSRISFLSGYLYYYETNWFAKIINRKSYLKAIKELKELIS